MRAMIDNYAERLGNSLVAALFDTRLEASHESI